MTFSLDAEALLAALVLAPSTYSRNRFFDLYRRPEMRRIRRRAAVLRSITRQLTTQKHDGLRVSTTTSGDLEISYSVPELGFSRRASLKPFEASLVRYVVANRSASALDASPRDTERVLAALGRLAPPMDDRGAARLEAFHDPE